jgi:hypothetical protein
MDQTPLQFAKTNGGQTQKDKKDYPTIHQTKVAKPIK